jgi:hypothetical protein
LAVDKNDLDKLLKEIKNRMKEKILWKVEKIKMKTCQFIDAIKLK